MRYDIISSKWSSHFFMFFLPFLGGKCTKCQQIAAKCLTMSYSTCHILHVFRQFLIFGTIQDGTQCGDHFECRHRSPAARQPKICTSSCTAHHRLLLMVKSFQNPRGGSINPPLYHGGGVTLLVHPSVNLVTFLTHGLD